MEPKLRRYVKDQQERLEILRSVYCETHRTGQSVLPPGLIMAVLDVESGFDRWAVSSAGAVGLMQVMPFWPEQLGMRRYELTRITPNLHMGCAILRFYLDSERRDVRRALERYNGSIGRRDYPDRVIVRWTHLLARRRRPGARGRSRRPEIRRQLRRVKLDDLHHHVGDLGGRRPDPEPVDELVHPAFLAVGEHLDPPVLEVARMPGDPGRTGALLGTGAVVTPCTRPETRQRRATCGALAGGSALMRA